MLAVCTKATLLSKTQHYKLSPHGGRSYGLPYKTLHLTLPNSKRTNSDDDIGKGSSVRHIETKADETLRHRRRSDQLRSDYHKATLVDINPSYREDHHGTYVVSLDVGSKRYKDMGCIQVLPINSPSNVRRALRALGTSGSEKLCLNISSTEDPSFSTFLSEYIDLYSYESERRSQDCGVAGDFPDVCACGRYADGGEGGGWVVGAGSLYLAAGDLEDLTVIAMGRN